MKRDNDIPTWLIVTLLLAIIVTAGIVNHSFPTHP